MLNLSHGTHSPYAQRRRPTLSAAGSDLSRRALEAFALEEFKAGWLTEPQLRQLLGLQTRHELDGFLKAHEVWLDYTLGNLERDRETHRQLGL